MSIPLSVFRLFRFQSGGCQHLLLQRVTRPAYRNALVPEEQRAYLLEEQARDSLNAYYQTRVIPRQCDHPHRLSLVGQFEGIPPGDQLSEEHGAAELAIWMAKTQEGPPWVVFGTAPDEETFWSDLDELGAADLGCRPLRPAESHIVFFLTEADVGMTPIWDLRDV